MARKRQLTKRHVKILALQRCSKAISLVGANGIYMPEDLDGMMKLEIDLECAAIAQRLRERLADLAMREWPEIEVKSIYDSSNNLNLRNTPG